MIQFIEAQPEEGVEVVDFSKLTAIYYDALEKVYHLANQALTDVSGRGVYIANIQKIVFGAMKAGK